MLITHRHFTIDIVYRCWDKRYVGCIIGNSDENYRGRLLVLGRTFEEAQLAFIEIVDAYIPIGRVIH